MIIFQRREGHLSAMFVQLILTSLQLIIVSQFNDDEILKIMNDDIVSFSSRLCTLLSHEIQQFKNASAAGHLISLTLLISYALIIQFTYYNSFIQKLFSIYDPILHF